MKKYILFPALFLVLVLPLISYADNVFTDSSCSDWTKESGGGSCSAGVFTFVNDNSTLFRIDTPSWMSAGGTWYVTYSYSGSGDLGVIWQSSDAQLAETYDTGLSGSGTITDEAVSVPAGSINLNFTDAQGDYGFLGTVTLDSFCVADTAGLDCEIPPAPPATTTPEAYAPSEDEWLFVFGLLLFLMAVPFWDRSLTITKGKYDL